MRDWYIAAVAAEYFSRLGTALGSESPSEELTAYTYHGTWDALIADLVTAADRLSLAVGAAKRRGVEVDAYLTVEAFVDGLLAGAAEYGSWPPYYTLLPKIAKESIRE
jgi:hypothetical protein